MPIAGLIDADSETQFSRLAGFLEAESTNLVAFVGAGLSRQANLPLWDELLAKMDQACDAGRPRPAQVRRGLKSQSRDKLWQAEILLEQLYRDNTYVAFLNDTFVRNARRRTAAFQHLVRLNFRHFLTTNYDELIEDALGELARDEPDRYYYRTLDWESAADVRSFLLEFLHPGCDRNVVHLHGMARFPQTVVLSHSHYVDRYVKAPDFVERLSVLFSTMRIVFIGFSIEDPDLRFILRQVNTRLGQRSVPHFALIGHPPGDEFAADGAWERKRLENQFGINAIFYDDSNGHSVLPELLRALSTEHGGRTEWRSGARVESLPENMPRESVLRPAAGLAEGAQGPVAAEATLSPIDEADPHKGQFGGRAEVRGWKLSATVSPEPVRDLYEVRLLVESPAGTPPGDVVFHLHPTFPHPVKTISLKEGKARLRLLAYGAFTVGAVCDSGGTRLELDLSSGDFPRAFREA